MSIAGHQGPLGILVLGWCLPASYCTLATRAEVKSANVSSGNFNLERKLKKSLPSQSFYIKQGLGKSSKNRENLP